MHYYCRCHHVILACRSDYFRVLLERQASLDGDSFRSPSSIPADSTHDSSSNGTASGGDSEGHAANAAQQQAQGLGHSGGLKAGINSGGQSVDARGGVPLSTDLPTVEIGGISAGVMECVLDCAYTDGFPTGLSAEWLTASGVEALFDAADMLLLFSLKVSIAQLLSSYALSPSQREKHIEVNTRILLAILCIRSKSSKTRM